MCGFEVVGISGKYGGRQQFRVGDDTVYQGSGWEVGEAQESTKVTKKEYKKINLVLKASFVTSQFYLSSAQLRKK